MITLTVRYSIGSVEHIHSTFEDEIKPESNKWSHNVVEHTGTTTAECDEKMLAALRAEVDVDLAPAVVNNIPVDGFWVGLLLCSEATKHLFVTRMRNS